MAGRRAPGVSLCASAVLAAVVAHASNAAHPVPTEQTMKAPKLGLAWTAPATWAVGLPSSGTGWSFRADAPASMVVVEIKRVRAKRSAARFAAAFIASERHVASTRGEGATFATFRTKIAATPTTEFAAQYLGPTWLHDVEWQADLFFLFAHNGYDYVVKLGVLSQDFAREKNALRRLVRSMHFTTPPSA